jgi:hypothetical protein
MPPGMRDPIPIRRLLAVIRKLPPDKPVHNPKKWYLTQHEHWIGWLSEYDGPGAYGRDATITRDARFAYNHIVEPEMLLCLAKAAGVSPAKVATARSAAAHGRTLMQRAGAVRSIISWDLVAGALWPKYVSVKNLA